MIRTVIFDMGNVLVRFCHERMCRQMGALCGRTAADVRKHLIDSGLQAEFERGQLTEREFHARIERLMEQRVDFDALIEAGSDIFELNEPMIPVVDTLKARGYRLVLLSNTSISHFEFVRDRFDVLDRFDDYVLSYRIGALKPQAEIFLAAKESAVCAPDECFYTDDIADYVAAGRSHGFEAEVFTTTEKLREDLEKHGLRLGG